MYQEEIFSNAMTDAKREGYDELQNQVKGMEAIIERFLSRIFETTTAKTERDFHFSEF